MGLFSDGFKELKKASVPLYKAPKSIQETIEIEKVAVNGIFEVSKTVIPSVIVSMISTIRQQTKRSRLIFLRDTVSFSTA